MKTLKQVYIEPVYVETMLPFDLMEDGKVYISEKYSTSTHKCLCGCGTKTVLPINKNGSTFGWNLIKEQDGTISFSPSILNPTMVLQSLDPLMPSILTETFPSHHYIITKNVANFV